LDERQPELLEPEGLEEVDEPAERQPELLSESELLLESEPLLEVEGAEGAGSGAEEGA
jgi:hypothetical protein